MEHQKKNIIFMLGNYYPNYSANGLCVKNIVDFLKNGNNVVVICEKSNYSQREIEEFEGHTIIRIETKYIKKRVLSKLAPGNKERIRSTSFSVFLNRISWYLKAHLQKENLNRDLFSAFYQALFSLEKQIDVIIPVCFPYETVIAALDYKEKVNGNVKVLPYLFDKFSESNTLHRTNLNKRIKFNRHIMLEKNMIFNSEKVLATRDWEEHVDKYFSDQSEKIIYTEIPSLRPIPLYENAGGMNLNEDKINFVYTGSLNLKNRSPKYTLDLFSLCMLEKNKYTFHLYTVGNCTGLINKFAEKLPNQIINHGGVETKVAHQALNSADFLISIGNLDITQRPSKIYEYISCGKPIIHLYTDHRDPVITILNAYPYSCCIDQNQKELEENKKKLLAFVDRHINTPPLKFKDVENAYIEASPQFVSNKILNILNEN